MLNSTQVSSVARSIELVILQLARVLVHELLLLQCRLLFLSILHMVNWDARSHKRLEIELGMEPPPFSKPQSNDFQLGFHKILVSMPQQPAPVHTTLLAPPIPYPRVLWTRDTCSCSLPLPAAIAPIYLNSAVCHGQEGGQMCEPKSQNHVFQPDSSPYSLHAPGAGRKDLGRQVALTQHVMPTPAPPPSVRD